MWFYRHIWIILNCFELFWADFELILSMSNFAGEIKKASIAVLIQNLRINFLKFKKMKRNRNPTNKSVMKRYATLDSSIGSRLLLDRSSFGSRSVLVRFSFVLRSVLVHPSFILRSSFVRASFGTRRTIEEGSKKYRRYIWGNTEAIRRCIETLMGSLRQCWVLSFECWMLNVELSALPMLSCSMLNCIIY